MATATNGKAKRSKQEPRFPERKWGPFAGGSGVAVWLNSVETETGLRYFRSITLAPRRFQDPKTGKWRDAGSYRPVDLSALLLGLEAAHSFCQNTPLPGEPAEPEEIDSHLHGEESSETPTY